MTWISGIRAGLTIWSLVAMVTTVQAGTLPSADIADDKGGVGVRVVVQKDDGTKVLVTVTTPGTGIDNAAAAIANQINKDLGAGTADAVGNVVELLKGKGIGIVNGDIVKSKDDLIPFATVGLLEFDPNPINGQASLVTDAVVTAELAGGPSVSIDAITGENLFDLATALNGALDAAGVVTQLSGSGITVFGNAPEIDFGVTPAGSVGDFGILPFISTVPEPSISFLWSAVVLGLLALRLTRNYPSHYGWGG